MTYKNNKDQRTLSSKEKEHLIKRIAGVLQSREDILFAYIFGSFSSGQSFNDIDIGVFIPYGKMQSPLELELEIERELDDALRIPADVRIINNSPLSFSYNVLKSGTVIVDNNSSLRADFEGLICKKYFDYKHIRDEYLREIINAEV